MLIVGGEIIKPSNLASQALSRLHLLDCDTGNGYFIAMVAGGIMTVM